MKCAIHAEIDSVAYCAQCGRALCAECKRDVRGMAYCETCLAARVQGVGLPTIFGPGAGPSPGVALALGFIPGVGAIYNGQILKAMVQVLVFGSLIALGDRVGGSMETLFGLGAAAFYFYMVIDSYQTARRKQLGLPSEEWFGLGDMRMNAPIGAGLLIVLGGLFLLDNLGVPVLRHISRFWPVLLIVVGVILLQRRMGGSSASSPSPRGAPNPPREGPTNIPGPQGM
jgi:cell wall-active antibiotic response 4TMS protein YvqF